MEKSECETDERATFISNTVYLDNLLHDTSDCTAIIATREPKMPNTEIWRCARWPGRQPSFSFISFENDAIVITAGTEKTRRAESTSNVSIRFVTSDWF